MSAVVAIALITAGVAFLLSSALGLLRLPTFYARAHGVGKSETVGAVLVLAGLAVEHGAQQASAKLVLILVFAFIANPTAVHALARAARFVDEQRASQEPS